VKCVLRMTPIRASATSKPATRARAATVFDDCQKRSMLVGRTEDALLVANAGVRYEDVAVPGKPLIVTCTWTTRSGPARDLYSTM